MAVAARTLELARAREIVLARVELSAGGILAGIVAASFVVRTVAGWLRATPAYFADEYIYAELARSLAETGRPLIRGASANFPALLQPLVTAPAWLVDDVEISYRTVQTMGALAVSLAAVPAFLLARRVGLTPAAALASAAFAVAVPDLVLASFLLSEPFAYPLVLGAVAAATAALGRPTRRAQLTLLALSSLAILARVQFAILPACFALAVLVVGLRERRVRSALREQLLPLTVFALPLLALSTVGLRPLGSYGGVFQFEIEPLSLLEWTGADAMILLYSSGWIIVPGALLGLALALGRPRTRTELAFGTLASILTAAVLLQSALFAANTSERIQERYVFYVAPLLVVSFGLYAARGWPHRLAHALLAGALIILSTRAPIAGFAAADGKADSPFLWAVSWLERALGGVADASIAVAVTALALSLAGVCLSLRPRLGTGVVLGLALATCAAASAGAVVFELDNSAALRSALLPRERSWIDRTGLGEVALLRSRGGPRADALAQLFWNRSVRRVLLLPGADPFDGYRTERVRVSGDGSLLLGGKPVEGPLLVDEYGATVRLRGARPVAAAPNYTLWRPEGRPRLSLYALGRHKDGWLAGRGSLSLWPRNEAAGLAGRLEFSLSIPKAVGPVTLRFKLPGEAEYEARVVPDGSTTISLRVCSQGAWQASFSADSGLFVGGRLVSARASEPTFHVDESACGATRRPAVDAERRISS